MVLSFVKLNASGNDFIFIDGACNLTASQIIYLANRNFGVGCDQVVFIENRAKIDEKLTFDIRFFNSDGTAAGMCGNALRCLAGMYLQNGETALVNIKNGRNTSISKENNMGMVFMPPVILEKNLINIGNLHLVKVIQNDAEIEYSVSNEYNKNYVKILDNDTIFVTTIERGAGFTMACGSGICASAYYVYSTNLLKNSNIKAITQGVKIGNQFGAQDEILVKISAENIQLCGGWNFVFSGEISV